MKAKTKLFIYEMIIIIFVSFMNFIQLFGIFNNRKRVAMKSKKAQF